MAAVEENKPAQPGTPGSAPTAKARPPSQGDNPDNRGDSEGVTPAGLEGTEVYAPAEAGTDPDSLERIAKQLEANPGDDSNDHAENLRRRAAQDREQVLGRDDKPRDRRSASGKAEA